MHEVVNLILAKGNDGVPTVRACLRVAELVQAEVRFCRCDNVQQYCREEQGGKRQFEPLRL